MAAAHAISRTTNGRVNIVVEETKKFCCEFNADCRWIGTNVPLQQHYTYMVYGAAVMTRAYTLVNFLTLYYTDIIIYDDDAILCVHSTTVYTGKLILFTIAHWLHRLPGGLCVRIYVTKVHSIYIGIWCTHTNRIIHPLMSNMQIN